MMVRERRKLNTTVMLLRFTTFLLLDFCDAEKTHCKFLSLMPEVLALNNISQTIHLRVCYALLIQSLIQFAAKLYVWISHSSHNNIHSLSLPTQRLSNWHCVFDLLYLSAKLIISSYKVVLHQFVNIYISEGQKWIIFNYLKKSLL